MSRLHVAFGVCAIVIALGHLIRRLFLRGPDGPQKISLVSALLINVTLPATLVGAFMRVRHIELEGLITAVLGFSADTLVFAVASASFRWLPGMGDTRWQPSAPASTAGLNISLFFYPVIESIAGMEGVVKIAWLDLLNLVFIFTVFPTSFALSRKPAQSRPIDNSSASRVPLSHAIAEVPMTPATERQGDTINTDPAVSFDREPSPIPTGKEDQITLLEGVPQPAFNRDASSPSLRQLCKQIGIRVGVNPPLWAIAIGLALGLSGVDLPEFLCSLQTTVASANSVLSFFLIGLLLDLRLEILKALLKPALLSMALRYSIGICLGFTLYYTLGTLPVFSPMGRFILLIGFVMPTTVVTIVYAREWGWDPALPTLMVNLTIVVSFAVIWTLTACVGFPPGVISSSSSSLA